MGRTNTTGTGLCPKRNLRPTGRTHSLSIKSCFNEPPLLNRFLSTADADQWSCNFWFLRTMLPATAERGATMEFFTPPETDGSILYDPTKVVTHEKLSGRRHETIGGCSKLRKAETPSISRHLHIHNVLPCMTCREDKFWVIFVGPMVLPRLDISYNNCSRKLLRFGDYTRASF